MNAADCALALLRIQLWLARRGPVALAAVLLAAGGALAWSWNLAQPRPGPLNAPRIALPPAAAPLLAAPPAPAQNLAAFHQALGERRYAEQQLKTLFALADQAGLGLDAGQYKAGYDQDSRVHTYQVTLPVKGNYRAVWQFCLQALAAIPFASLDEISFRRDSIAEPAPEARVRFTLYLHDGAAPP